MADIPDGLESILALLTSPAQHHRTEYFDRFFAVARESGGGRAVAVLWLYDEGAQEYLLDRFYDPAGGAAPVSFHALAVPAGAPPDVPPVPPAAVEEWRASEGLGHSKFFPLAAERWVGYLQLLSGQPPGPAAVSLLSYIARGLALRIERGRQYRALQPLLAMQKHVDLSRPMWEWFRTAARLLAEAAKAELCLVYQQGGVRSDLRPVACYPPALPLDELHASPTSLIYQVSRATGTKRLKDVTDAAERLRVFGTRESDARLGERLNRHLLSGRQRAWLAAPVLIEGHAWAVFMLVNKTASLPGRFNEADVRMLEEVCNHLALVLPSVETFAAMSRITRAFESLSTAAALSSAFAEDEPSYRALYDELAMLLPGVAGLGLMILSAGSPRPEYWPFGGENWFDAAGSLTECYQTLREHARPVRHRDPDSGYWYAVPMRDSTDEVASLVVSLRRDYLTAYDGKVLRFVAAELRQHLRAKSSYDRLMNSIIQVRHAIRSPVNAVIGNAIAAVGWYEVLKADGQLAGLKADKLGDALRKIRLFADRTSVLMEESRILLTNLTRKNLRVGRYLLGRLVREVIDGLTFEAERRKTPIHLNTGIPNRLDDLSFDRDLLEMAIYNLIDNAIKYSHRDRPINIDLNLDGPLARIDISDTGVYIRPEDRDDIFRSFQRRPSGQAYNQRPGTGLGLTVAKKVIELHDGSIAVTSELLQQSPEPIARTCFTVRLPRRLSAREPS